MYTVQIDAHRHKIVCKGSTPRKGYRIVFTGTYAECQMYQPTFD